MGTVRIYLGILLAVSLVVRAEAYDHPLSSYAVRDAYFLGTDSERSARFLAPYIKAFSPAGPSQRYVSQIEVRTPYTQVAQTSRQQSNRYSAQQAEEDYKKNGDTVEVRVQILYPLSGEPEPLLPPPGCEGANHMNNALQCFHDFQFHFSQTKSLHPLKAYGVAIYSINSSLFNGGDLWFTFPADQLASAPLRVSVTDANGQEVSATFDLAVLR